MDPRGRYLQPSLVRGARSHKAGSFVEAVH